MNHAISIACSCIFYSNYEKVLRPKRELLDLVCSPSVGEEKAEKSETVSFAVGYMWTPGNINIG